MQKIIYANLRHETVLSHLRIIPITDIEENLGILFSLVLKLRDELVILQGKNLKVVKLVRVNLMITNNGFWHYLSTIEASDNNFYEAAVYSHTAREVWTSLGLRFTTLFSILNSSNLMHLIMQPGIKDYIYVYINIGFVRNY